jgi:5-methylcytosine-specific restriction enzyme A
VKLTSLKPRVAVITSRATRLVAQRMRGSNLTKRNNALLGSYRWCAACHTERATIVDHIIPLHLGGLDDVPNLQPLCKWCHDIKTSAEHAVRHQRC